MNFKKLLSLVGVLTVTVPTSMAVVACGNPQDNDKIQGNAILDILNDGIDGSSLKTINTYKDALKFMQETKDIKDIAILSFVNKEDGDKHLVDGDNLLNINIKVGNANITTEKAKLFNVNKADDNDHANDIKTKLETGVDGSNLIFNKSTQQDALNIMQNAIDKKIGQLSFVHDEDATKLLTTATTKLNINIKVGIVMLTTDAALINNVNKNQNIDDQAVNILKKPIDGSTLSKEQTGADALVLMQKQSGMPSQAQLSFVKSGDAEAKLHDGDNFFDVNVKVDLINVVVHVEIDGVNHPQDVKSMTAIKTALSKGVDGSTLVLNSSIRQDALNIMQVQVTAIDSDAIVSFVNPGDAAVKLTNYKDTFKVSIKVRELVEQLDNASVVDINKAQDQKSADDIKAMLEQGVDATSLDVSSDGTDVLKLVNSLAKSINADASLLFVEISDTHKRLTEGKMQFQIQIFVNFGKAQATANLININKHYNDEISKATNAAKYSLTAVDGDSAQSVKEQITTSYITAQLPWEYRNVFAPDHFHFNDITVNGKALTDQDLHIVGTINAKISYSYAKVEGEANLTITVGNKFTDLEIQEHLKSEITVDKPLHAKCKAGGYVFDVMMQVSSYIRNLANKSFDEYVKGDYQVEFDILKLGVYTPQLYSSNDMDHTVPSDFFDTPGTKSAYVYIGYNKDAQTHRDGFYAPIIIEIVSS